MKRAPLSHSRRKLLTALVVAPAVAFACAARTRPTRSSLPPPSELTLLGVGDVFTMEIAGEKDLPREYQVARDGTVDFPYLHTVKVAGLEPQEVARLVRERLMAEKILVDPTVIVQVKEYHSRNVTLLGQVARPGTFPLTSGMTLLTAISLAGGLTSIAKGSAVRLTRTNKGKTITVFLNVEAMNDGDEKDVPLQAGDRIYVDERLF